ncbi:MAG: hypothetical protein WC810_14030 [Janthinobacterium sp.]
MRATIRGLLDELDQSLACNDEIIRWASPVPVFGDLKIAKVATLGLNPSNREFVNAIGEPLTGELRRFHSLATLGLVRWSSASDKQIDEIIDSCRQYFFNNPYDAWFRSLDNILLEAGFSYYSKERHACHLDLVPYATKIKWGSLGMGSKEILLNSSKNLIGNILQSYSISVLLLNGQGVVNLFCDLLDSPLEATSIDGWKLARSNGSYVEGRAYRGIVTKIAGVDLGRRLLVIGYNHNIQSSFGVSNQVRISIANWIKIIVGEFDFET